MLRWLGQGVSDGLAVHSHQSGALETGKPDDRLLHKDFGAEQKLRRFYL
jgi:hypothetical protein